MVKVNMRDIGIQVWPRDPASYWCLRCLYLSELLKVLDKCVCLWMCFKTSCRLLGGLRRCSIWAVHKRDRLSPSVWRLPATSKVLMWTRWSLKLAEVLSTSLSFLFSFNLCFSLFLSFSPYMLCHLRAGSGRSSPCPGQLEEKEQVGSGG